MRWDPPRRSISIATDRKREATDAHYVHGSPKWFTVFWGLSLSSFALFRDLAENLIPAINISVRFSTGCRSALFLVGLLRQRDRRHRDILGGDRWRRALSSSSILRLTHQLSLVQFHRLRRLRAAELIFRWF